MFVHMYVCPVELFPFSPCATFPVCFAFPFPMGGLPFPMGYPFHSHCISLPFLASPLPYLWVASRFFFLYFPSLYLSSFPLAYFPYLLTPLPVTLPFHPPNLFLYLLPFPCTFLFTFPHPVTFLMFLGIFL